MYGYDSKEQTICIGGGPRYPHITGVFPLEDFRLLIEYEGDEYRIFDVSPLLKSPLYAELNDREFFERVQADAMCVYWDDETDIAPEVLWWESEKARSWRCGKKTYVIVDEQSADEQSGDSPKIED
jgi:hypothetical protein